MYYDKKRAIKWNDSIKSLLKEIYIIRRVDKMIRKYKFPGEGSLEFDDNKTVSELLEYAFDKFGYYEPFGMDTVTLYQISPPHFVLDTSKLCCEEIEGPDWLCFAYHIPGFLYYAEGGWGHHMHELINHPVFNDPVSLILKFEDFRHTVVFEGTHTFREVINLLMEVGYIDTEIRYIKAWVMAYPKTNYSEYIYLSDPILDAPMTEFEKTLPSDGIVTLILGDY